MNTPQNHPDNSHDWHDALLDRGLAEIVGGETPPDLSEKILATACADSQQPTVTLASESRVLPNSKRRHWAMFAAAACLFLSVGTWLVVSQPRYRRDNKSYAKAEPTEVQQEEKSLPELSTPYQRLGRADKSKVNDATSSAKEQSRDPMMAVTPHIIIQEGEEERLSAGGNVSLNLKPEIATQKQAERRLLASGLFRADPNTNPSKRSAKQSSLPAPSATTFAQDESGEGEQTSAPPVSYDAETWQDLSARRKKYARSDLRSQNPDLKRLSDEGAGTQADHFFAEHHLETRRHSLSYGNKDLDPWKRGLYESQGYVFAEPHPTPQPSRDQYTPIHENPFVKAIGPDAVSTFSIDVDTASYANVRQFLTQSRQLPPPDAVRIEELINYFDYDYAGPKDDTPFAAYMEVAACPWNAEHRLARIAIKGKEIDRQERPQSNLVFLIDVSGSMNEPNKLPLLVEGMKLLTRELGENDKVGIVVYASTEGVVLESTRGDEQETILAALNRLQAGGSTAGGAGINRAYQIALDNFIEGATNRVILCTDGDFNVGVTSTDDLTRLAEQKAKTGVFLTVLGFGRGNLNDAMMESISGRGNGNYHYVDSLTEARKVLVEEMTGTLITIAKDVKIQVEFNPAKVAGYRLIGYENRMLATEDFNDDKKDAGEIGAGHTVTALYEIVPAGKEVSPPKADPLKYQLQNPPPGYSGEGLGEGSSDTAKPQAASNELLTLKLRYKLPDADKSTKLEFPITDNGESFAESTKDFQFAAAVASFGMLLRHSQHQGETSFDAVSEIAQSAIGNDPHNYRAEFLELVRIAKQLAGN